MGVIAEESFAPGTFRFVEAFAVFGAPDITAPSRPVETPRVISR
jgi:hypothetical protein